MHACMQEALPTSYVIKYCTVCRVVPSDLLCRTNDKCQARARNTTSLDHALPFEQVFTTLDVQLKLHWRKESWETIKFDITWHRIGGGFLMADVPPSASLNLHRCSAHATLASCGAMVMTPCHAETAWKSGQQYIMEIARLKAELLLCERRTNYTCLGRRIHSYQPL